jgi:hypothetical protein
MLGAMSDDPIARLNAALEGRYAIESERKILCLNEH